MKTYIYAFGSICRGEFDRLSDVDLLVVTDDADNEFDPEKFSIYSLERIKRLWKEGNPFAWHLHLESSIIYSSDGVDFLKSLLIPSAYEDGFEDCQKFMRLFKESYNSLLESDNSAIFKISCLFLAVRNFSTCYSLAKGFPVFSRKSPLLIDKPLKLSMETFEVLMSARILSTRGVGEVLKPDQIGLVLLNCPLILNWMEEVIKEVSYE